MNSRSGYLVMGIEVVNNSKKRMYIRSSTVIKTKNCIQIERHSNLGYDFFINLLFTLIIIELLQVVRLLSSRSRST